MLIPKERVVGKDTSPIPLLEAAVSGSIPSQSRPVVQRLLPNREIFKPLIFFFSGRGTS